MKPESIIQPVEEALYRCPGCGQRVDSRRMEEVLLHHQHVLAPAYPPAWFKSRATHLQGTTPREPHQTESPRPGFARSPSDLRRYGH